MHVARGQSLHEGWPTKHLQRKIATSVTDTSAAGGSFPEVSQRYGLATESADDSDDRRRAPRNHPSSPRPLLLSIPCSAHLSTINLLSRLRTGVCDLCAYRAHFDLDKELCQCGEVESREHFLLLCPTPLPALNPLTSANSIFPDSDKQVFPLDLSLLTPL